MTKAMHLKNHLAIGLLLFSYSLHASFIEQTLGSAVVNDATAVYFNPAILSVLPNQQLIMQSTLARSQFQFTGNAQKLPFGMSESGSTNTTSNFFLPSLYTNISINDTIAAGFAIVANDFNRDLESQSILRYVQPRNQTNDVDLVPALSVKINKFLAIGGNLSLSWARLDQEPISTGITRLNIIESRSQNNSKANSLGGDFGVLITPAKKTAIGFNYRSAITYNLHGTSSTTEPQPVFSDNFHFKFWTPARSVLSLSHFIDDQLGFIGTAQYLQWDIFKQSNIYNFVAPVNAQNIIIPQATINYNFHNSWLLTLGTIYNVSSKWIVRMAGTYNQAPSNGRFQIDTGDSVVAGFSMGYQMMKHLAVDCSYSHAFFKQQPINIATAQNIITGTNQGALDAFSLKLTFSM